MSHIDWLYMTHMNAWWRTIGNKVPINGKIFDYRPPNCQRCNDLCHKASEYREKFYCLDCNKVLVATHYNIFKFLIKRETII